MPQKADQFHRRRLRWARNIVRTFESAHKNGNTRLPNGAPAHWVARYERAAALLLAEKLRAS